MYFIWLQIGTMEGEAVEVSEGEGGKDEEVWRRGRKSSALCDRDVLCEFPLGRSPNVTVTLRDYKTLQLGTYVNDIIIDFYLSWIYERLAHGERSKVHLFTTLFYSRLVTVPTIINDENRFEESVSLDERMVYEVRHKRVERWTKNTDLFDKELVIVPVCQNSHWFLLVVVSRH